ncbi:hypothetical protein PsYK624_088650 [Phanerochaete sordida]|uniref:Uncharacterized protein n=1 Tax=Phanerochaete sordida TaxID=48140 RepID=A0A9P3LFJ5_9APHY|nr:hypothetical protein PsYK624_088650 [Phanerochaete sordida]
MRANSLGHQRDSSRIVFGPLCRVEPCSATSKNVRGAVDTVTRRLKDPVVQYELPRTSRARHRRTPTRATILSAGH